jgi:putative membrane protein
MMSSITLLASVAQQMGWRGDDMNWGGGGWLAMGLLMILFWAAVLGFGIWAVRSTSHRHDTVPGAGGRVDSAMDLARERYARGEISEEEFQRIKRGLS